MSWHYTLAWVPSAKRPHISAADMAILWPVYKDWPTSGWITSHPPTCISPSTRASSHGASIASEAREWESEEEANLDDTDSIAYDRLVEEEFLMHMDTPAEPLKPRERGPFHRRMDSPTCPTCPNPSLDTHLKPSGLRVQALPPRL